MRHWAGPGSNCLSVLPGGVKQRGFWKCNCEKPPYLPSQMYVLHPVEDQGPQESMGVLHGEDLEQRTLCRVLSFLRMNFA